MILRRDFYRRPVLDVARDLLGMRLVRIVEKELPIEGGGRLEGTIVEVEAYDGPEDKACHASRGLTKRTEPMFGEPGHAYVYLVYGMHHCLNVVTGPVGYPSAVLIRAIDPIPGPEWTIRGDSAPGIDRARPSLEGVHESTTPVDSSARGRRGAHGPGLLTRAFGIDLALNRVDLCSEGPLFIERGERIPERRIVRGERIGVEYAGAWARRPWRLGIRDHPALSKAFPDDGSRSSGPRRRAAGARRA